MLEKKRREHMKRKLFRFFKALITLVKKVQVTSSASTLTSKIKDVLQPQFHNNWHEFKKV